MAYYVLKRARTENMAVTRWAGLEYSLTCGNSDELIATTAQHSQYRCWSFYQRDIEDCKQEEEAS